MLTVRWWQAFTGLVRDLSVTEPVAKCTAVNPARRMVMPPRQGTTMPRMQISWVRVDAIVLDKRTMPSSSGRRHGPPDPAPECQLFIQNFKNILLKDT
jgi:hypothetical protein